MKWIVRIFAALLLLVLLAAGALTLVLRASLPQAEGRIALPGLAGEVEVLRDEYGVPTIRASSEADAVFALGFVHAQDRLWQMDFLRRLGAGRLSEILGPRSLDFDRLMRTLGLAHVAEANTERLGADALALLGAYAGGVNAYIDRAGPFLPPEFLILRYRPEPWRPVDSILWGRLMALQLSDNYREELNRARIAAVISADQLAFLYPSQGADGPITLGARASDEAVRLADLLLDIEAPPVLAAGGSNAWVIAGSGTASGKPVLANDPHLGLSAPTIWYLARIEAPGLTLVGATVPGVPAALIGHNGRIAWGFTTTHSDTQDLFVERLAGEDAYDTPLGPTPFLHRREIIRVKGADPVELDVRETRHGPVISDIRPEAGAAVAGAGHVLALAWPALAEDDRTAEAVLALNRAGNWEQFRRALRDFHSPQQNIFYADREGTIAMMAPARVPIRARGDGRVPAPGWDGTFDWQGYIPFERLPYAVNPPSGRIFNANNRIVPESYPFLISMEWEPPYRARRLEQVLSVNGQHTPEAAAALQIDSLSLAAQNLLPSMLMAAPSSERQRTALDRLKSWDGRMDRNLDAPLLFTAWLDQLTRAIFADELGAAFDGFAFWNVEQVARVLGEDQGWCDDVTTPAATETCDDQLRLSLDRALDMLAARLGDDIDRWRWGDLHLARFSHPLFGRLPILRRATDLAIEADGDNYTVNRASPRPRGEPLFEAIHGAGLRVVFDLADLDRSRFVIATGQSGHPLSSHYGDLLGRWRDGGFVTIVGTDRPGVRRLVLEPARPEASAQ